MPNDTRAQELPERFAQLGMAFALLGMSIAGFVFGVVTIVLLALVWAWVVIPALLAMAAVIQVWANVHRRIAGRILGVTIPEPYLPVPRGGWFARLIALARDPARWRDVAWLFVNFTCGFGLMVVVVSLFLGAAWEFIYPLLWSLAPGAFGEYLGFITIDSLSEAFLYSYTVGAIYLVLWWQLSPILMRANAHLTRLLLAPTASSRLKKRVQQLAESRAETVDTQAAELRRIERDLHDGAQARLVALGMSLGLADEAVDRDPAAARELLAEARQSTSQALAELRSLVRGIHPPVLADRGLAGAVQSLVLASPLPTDVDVEISGRLPAPVESAAYFAVAESLTNVVKHSGATKAWVRLRHSNGRLSMQVSDNGHGGAEASAGTGLRGIERRLAAFDGGVVVSSPAGGPTVVTMELPCELSSPKTSPSSGTG